MADLLAAVGGDESGGGLLYEDDERILIPSHPNLPLFGVVLVAIVSRWRLVPSVLPSSVCLSVMLC